MRKRQGRRRAATTLRRVSSRRRSRRWRSEAVGGLEMTMPRSMRTTRRLYLNTTAIRLGFPVAGA